MVYVPNFDREPANLQEFVADVKELSARLQRHAALLDMLVVQAVEVSLDASERDLHGAYTLRTRSGIGCVSVYQFLYDQQFPKSAAPVKPADQPRLSYDSYSTYLLSLQRAVSAGR